MRVHNVVLDLAKSTFSLNFWDSSCSATTSLLCTRGWLQKPKIRSSNERIKKLRSLINNVFLYTYISLPIFNGTMNLICKSSFGRNHFNLALSVFIIFISLNYRSKKSSITFDYAENNCSFRNKLDPIFIMMDLFMRCCNNKYVEEQIWQIRSFRTRDAENRFKQRMADANQETRRSRNLLLAPEA